MEKHTIQIGKLGSILGVLAGFVELSVGSRIPASAALWKALCRRSLSDSRITVQAAYCFHSKGRPGKNHIFCAGRISSARIQD